MTRELKGRCRRRSPCQPAFSSSRSSVAKCFLSAGFFAYGDWFRRAAQHWEPRLLMNRWRRGLSESDAATMETSIFFWYESDLADPEQAEEFETQKVIASAVNGSVRVFMPGPGNLGFFGGVPGQYLGMLNVLADTKDFIDVILRRCLG